MHDYLVALIGLSTYEVIGYDFVMPFSLLMHLIFVWTIHAYFAWLTVFTMFAALAMFADLTSSRHFAYI